MSVELNQQTADSQDKSVAGVRRVLAGMQDALTDEMVSRIAATVSEGAGLLDQLGRSGVIQALPVLARMTENGDLERVAQLARVVGAAQDALTDEMVVRLAGVLSQSMSLFERLNRAGLDNLVRLLPRMIALFERLEQQQVVDDLVNCLNKATQQASVLPEARGGLGGLWAIAREADNQDALRFLLLVSRQFCSCRTERQSAQSKS